MTIEVLTRATGWYGNHSGYYERLPACLTASGINTRVTQPGANWHHRAIGKMIAVARGLPDRNQSLTLAESIFLHRLRPNNARGHVLAFESHIPMFSRRASALRRIVTTLHSPPELLTPAEKQALPGVAGAIVLYQRDLDYFVEKTGTDRIKFARHGVDTEFFRPAETRQGEEPRLVYVGQFGRDTQQAERVIPRILELHPTLQIDVVIAQKQFRDPALASLDGHDRIEWHFGISDLALRDIYQHASMLFLPMRASGANNAIVEALASGLPIVTNDVGGIRDYGGGELFPVPAPNDDDGMISLVEYWLSHDGKRREVGDRSRQFALDHLQWADCARAHAQAYQELFN